ncbi:WXG100 family type VII secretion target [Lentzea sp. NPDC006480]|uniref:WXG100 family type VII secretion target n=1 Tax=Lentzea sp. NPDC006480 TaxID=3157176 RepID=UPI0033B16BB8
MAGYVASAEELAALGKHIQEVDAQTQATLRGVANTVDGLRSVWTGAAATAFNALMERYNEDARNLQQALQGIAEQVGVSADTYRKQEEEAQNLSQSISNRL